MEEIEEWRPIQGYSKIYSISSLGRVYNDKLQRFLTGSHDKDGYIRVDLSLYGCKTHFFVHVLVAREFIGPPPESWYEVNHKDGIKDNNVLSNLEWLSPGGNAKHAFRIGLKVPTGFANNNFSKLGSDNGRALLTEEDVREIRRLYRETSILQKDLAKRYNVGITAISRIILRMNWVHIE